MKEAIVIMLVMIGVVGGLIVSIRARNLGWSMMRVSLTLICGALTVIGSYATSTLLGVKAMVGVIVLALTVMVVIVELASFVEDDSGNWFDH